jgi:hypothetical protein
MATVTVTQSALVTNTFASLFQNNLTAADLFNWHKHEGEMDDLNGLTVIEQVDPSYVVTETTSGVKDLSGGVQDTVFGSERYTLNKTFGVSMGYGDFVAIRDLNDARKSRALKRAAMRLAEHIDKYILSVASVASNNWCVASAPTAGIDTYGDFMQGYTRLKEMGVEDGDFRGVLTYQDKEDLGEAVIALSAPDGMVTQTYREGFSGQIGGIPVLFTQQLPTFTNGNDVTGVAVDGAAQNVDYTSVCNSASQGRYLTQTLHVDGVTTGTGTVTAGSVFTIDNVYEWDNRAQQSTGRLQQFTVVSGGTASGVSDIDLVIFPAMIVQGTSDVNTAHATVDSAPADDAAITFIGAASTTYKPRLLTNKDALNIVTKDLIKPMSGTSERVQLKKIPASVRMWMDSTFATGEHRVRFDIALTANVADRRRIVRLNG